jgi:hypothetical protein
MFLVIHEHRRPEHQLEIRCVGRTFKILEDAQRAAMQVAKDFKVRAWTYEVDDPPVLEVVLDND